MLKKTITLAIFIALIAIFAASDNVSAINLTTKVTQIGTAAGFSTTSSDSIAVIIGQLINAVLSLLGIIFMIYIVYAGYLWMTAHGNDEKITKAKAIIRGSIIGLIIVLAAYAITAFVITRVIEATKYAGTTPAT